jgi:hypothetical protein
VDLHQSSREAGAKAPGRGATGESGDPPSPVGQGGGEIMAKLPRSRPRRTTTRRKQARTAPRKASPKASSARRAAPPKAAAAPPQRPFPPSEPAPGLPRLALDGAVEAAKYPLKVGAGITFRALDAIARGLRGD